MPRGTNKNFLERFVKDSCTGAFLISVYSLGFLLRLLMSILVSILGHYNSTPVFRTKDFAPFKLIHFEHKSGLRTRLVRTASAGEDELRRLWLKAAGNGKIV